MYHSTEEVGGASTENLGRSLEVRLVITACECLNITRSDLLVIPADKEIFTFNPYYKIILSQSQTQIGKGLGLKIALPENFNQQVVYLLIAQSGL